MPRFSISLLVVLLINHSCTSDFLEKKPNKSHVVPSKLADFEALLDDDIRMNGSGNSGRGQVPALGEAGSDDYYLTDAAFISNLTKQTQNYYTWEKDIYAGMPGYDWQFTYESIMTSNVVLDGLRKIEKDQSNAKQYDRVKGSALFFRGHAFYQLAQVYCPPYGLSSDQENYGLPLRKISDLNENLNRSTVNQTYQQIIKDLEESLIYLPEIPAVTTRPSKVASYGLLSRVYLTMGHYEEALLYADSCLKIKNTLIDYKTLNKDASYPFAGGAYSNSEVIFACNMMLAPTNMPFRPTFAYVDTTLYRMYNLDDLRKYVFFQNGSNGVTFKGSYEGNSYFFAGIALDEIYLNKAECLVRKGYVKEGIETLLQLLVNRYKVLHTEEFLLIKNQEDALNLILNERRKELLFRGIRWADLRRLNREGFNFTLKRLVNNNEFYLYPNDKRYVYPIPTEVIAFHSDWPQNER
jgi:tetratricopeptide (TPR) repeat protein